jgi:hypothetical protein
MLGIVEISVVTCRERAMKTYEITLEITFLAAILHLYGRLAVPVNNLEGPKYNVRNAN